jgi:GDP-4-dehydro-6-deoxy-D-mannose reductase
MLHHENMVEERILLTGATGFVGPRLRKALRAGPFKEARFLVWDHRPDAAHISSPAHLATNIDIRCAAAVADSIARFRPTRVVHLAAQSHVPTAFAKPELTWQVNVMGTLHLFEALRRHAPAAGVLYVSSSEVYGRSFQRGAPVDETALLQPQNPYAASKAAADIMAGEYAARGLRVVRLRPFNHIGPGQREEFVAAAFAAQVARIEAGLQEPVVRVGNLEARRDFLDVADVVRAYVLALEKIDTLPPGLVLNLCSGTVRRIGDLLDGLLALSACPVRVEPDPARLRPSDTPVAAGSAAAAATYLGWRPEVPFDVTLRTIMDDWRARVRPAVRG